MSSFNTIPQPHIHKDPFNQGREERNGEEENTKN